ncbi:MAG TPA: glycosyltransferase family 9 protein, partial [Gemmatimonadaceae bacterium]|nr:glycosyltransferase family 9 protein [Gemmatimonadaceae bacterium]
PLHMAVALDRPVISLLGFSNPMRTGPYRASQELIINAYGNMWNGSRLATDRRDDRMQAITVADVLAKVELWIKRYAEGAASKAPNS